jgi:hypothetical protein
LVPRFVTRTSPRRQRSAGAKLTISGAPADAAGNVTLVGAGELMGGSSDTDDFAVSVAGVVQPRPA